jgi:hypothetical protein
MSIPRMAIALATMLTASASPAAAQRATAELDSVRTQIRITLRAFYFNLAHRDWEALAADILSAKVMASHPAPESLLELERHPVPTDGAGACSSDAASRIEKATITLDGDWAEASVRHCPATAAVDEFRLVRFERRWRIIYIELRQEPGGGQLLAR